MRILFSILLCFVILFSCTRETPTQKDGELTFNAIITDPTEIIPVNPDLGYAPVAGAKVTLVSSSYYSDKTSLKQYSAYTDSAGLVIFNDLAGSSYNMNIEAEVTYTNQSGIMDTVMLISGKMVDIFSSSAFPDTIEMTPSKSDGIVINEIYSCGPVSTAYYYFDQYIELYNASENTVYLDGIIVGRGRQTLNDSLETVDYAQATYLFHFPGEPLTGREYPFLPGEFLVLAQDALDHSQYIPTSLDLSDADWEFFDQYGGADIDNPAPNILNYRPDKDIDFMIGLTSNVIFLTDGSEWYYGDCYPNSNSQFIHLPLETVIDAVEYASSAELTHSSSRRLDAGFAGIGITRYSGKSTERRLPGFDTDNSTVDFVVNNVPTPGYQHE